MTSHKHRKTLAQFNVLPSALLGDSMVYHTALTTALFTLYKYPAKLVSFSHSVEWQENTTQGRFAAHCDSLRRLVVYQVVRWILF